MWPLVRAANSAIHPRGSPDSEVNEHPPHIAMSIRLSSRHLLGAAAVALSLGVASSARAQTFTLYTDRTAFESTLFSYVHENFDGGALTAPGLSFTSTNGSVVVSPNGYFHDVVDRGVSSTTWMMSTYPGGVHAFGGNWDLQPGGPGEGIEFSILLPGGPVLVPFQIPNTYSGGFWGFISDTRFSAVRYTGGTTSAFQETYDVDDVTFGIAAVPEPSTYTLMGTGLVMLVGAARRRRTAR